MTREIPLTQGKVAIVDDADFEPSMKYKWSAKPGHKNCWYAQRSFRTAAGAPRTQTLHRFLMNPKEGEPIDHIDGDGLNCTRANMRLCSAWVNSTNRGMQSHNTSGYRGVYFHPRDKRRKFWRAIIVVKNVRIPLGYHHTAEQAARAYDKAALKYRDELARLNFPDEARA